MYAVGGWGEAETSEEKDFRKTNSYPRIVFSIIFFFSYVFRFFSKIVFFAYFSHPHFPAIPNISRTCTGPAVIRAYIPIRNIIILYKYTPLPKNGKDKPPHSSLFLLFAFGAFEFGVSSFDIYISVFGFSAGGDSTFGTLVFGISNIGVSSFGFLDSAN